MDGTTEFSSNSADRNEGKETGRRLVFAVGSLISECLTPCFLEELLLFYSRSNIEGSTKR